MVLLPAVTSVGIARGEGREYVDANGVTWVYKEIEAGATCRIEIPESSKRGSISGFVEILGTVEDGRSIRGLHRADGGDYPQQHNGDREQVFEGCRGLTAVTIPGSVMEIGRSAFVNCSELNAFYWLADANFGTDGNAFYGIVSPAMLYVW